MQDGYAPLESYAMNADGDCMLEDGSDDSRILMRLAGLLAECLTAGEVAQGAIEHLVRAIELCLARLSQGEAVPAYGANALLTWQEQMAKAMLLDDAASPAQVGAVARACGMSYRHFSRAFKATVGSSPQRWRLVQRIERAKVLMLEGDFNLTSIAYECGFAEQSHFNHTFYKLAGESPSAWRRRCRYASVDSSIASCAHDAPADHQPDPCSVGR